MRAAVIGTGFGSRVVAPVYAELGIEVEVVSPRDRDGIRRACAKPVDFVSIHSPPFLHHEHVTLALAQGRNVLCEKPFGRSVEEAQVMLDAAESAGVVHLVNYEFRQDSARRQAKDWIDQGIVGQVQHVGWTLYSNGSRGRVHGWLFDKDAGGGWIGAYGAHVIDALRWLIGEVATAGGTCRIDIPLRSTRDGDVVACTAEDAFSATLLLANGVTASIDTAFGGPIYRPSHIEIIGTDGLIVLDGYTDIRLKLPGKADQKLQYDPPTGDPHEPSFRKWAAILKQTFSDRAQIRPSFVDGVACAAVMEQLRKNAVWSANQGHREATGAHDSPVT
jgi:predicted dehydrogenase